MFPTPAPVLTPLAPARGAGPAPSARTRTTSVPSGLDSVGDLGAFLVCRPGQRACSGLVEDRAGVEVSVVPPSPLRRAGPVSDRADRAGERPGRHDGDVGHRPAGRCGATRTSRAGTRAMDAPASRPPSWPPSACCSSCSAYRTDRQQRRSAATSATGTSSAGRASPRMSLTAIAVNIERPSGRPAIEEAPHRDHRPHSGPSRTRATSLGRSPGEPLALEPDRSRSPTGSSSAGPN